MDVTSHTNNYYYNTKKTINILLLILKLSIPHYIHVYKMSTSSTNINHASVPTVLFVHSYLFDHLCEFLFLVLPQFPIVLDRGYMKSILCLWLWWFKGAGQNSNFSICYGLDWVIGGVN